MLSASRAALLGYKLPRAEGSTGRLGAQLTFAHVCGVAGEAAMDNGIHRGVSGGVSTVPNVNLGGIITFPVQGRGVVVNERIRELKSCSVRPCEHTNPIALPSGDGGDSVQRNFALKQ